MPTGTAPRAERVHDALGAEITGVDLRNGCDDVLAGWLRERLAEHHLLVFRDVPLAPEHQRALLARLGEVVDETGDGRGWSYVSNVRADGVLAEGRQLLFHADNLFTAEPLGVLSLYGERIEGPGAPTRFANAERAWRELSAGSRSRLEGLDVVNLSGFAGGWYRYRDAEVAPHHPRAVHPLVARNPRTGRPAVRAGEQQTDRVLGLDPEESEAVLQELFSYLYAPDNVHEHHWRTDDLLVWDNLALQHGRPALAAGGERTLRRVVAVDGGVERQHTWGAVSLAAEGRPRA